MKSIKRIAQKLRAIPLEIAKKVATAAAPVLTEMSLETFDAQQSPAGRRWKPGIDGKLVTLVKSGTLRAGLRYVVVDGTKLRVSLGAPYARYQIGKRKVFPAQRRLPVAYTRALQDLVTQAGGEILSAP